MKVWSISVKPLKSSCILPLLISSTTGCRMLIQPLRTTQTVSCSSPLHRVLYFSMAKSELSGGHKSHFLSLGQPETAREKDFIPCMERSAHFDGLTLPGGLMQGNKTTSIVQGQKRNAFDVTQRYSICTLKMSVGSRISEDAKSTP